MTRTAAGGAGVAVVYLVLAVLLFWSSWQSPFITTIGAGSDVEYTVWFYRWVAYALTHAQNPLVTTHLDYPAGVNLMWNGFTPLPAMVLAPVTLTLGPVIARTILMTIAVAGSAFTAYLAISRYVSSRSGAFLGGLLYGFSPFMLAHSLGHPQLTIALIPPLLLLALDEVVVRQRQSWIRAGAILGVLCALQLWTGEELLATAALVAILGIALLAGLHPSAVRRKAPYALRAIALGAGVALILSSFPLAVQFLGPQQVRGMLQPLNLSVSDLLNFVLPTQMQALAPRAAVALTQHFSSSLSEWNAYLGIPLILILGVTATRTWKVPVMRFATLLGGLIAILSLGVTVHIGGTITALPIPLLGLVFPRLRALPGRTMLFTLAAAWAALVLLPVLDNILPNRLMLYVFLFAALLLAGFVERVRRIRVSRTRAVGAALIALALAPLIPSLPYPSVQLTSPAFFRVDASTDIPTGETALIAPYARVGQARAMYWQAVAAMAFRMPEGEAFIPGPPPIVPDPPPTPLGNRMVQIERDGGSAIDPGQRGAMLADLDTWRVRTVIVGPMAHESDMVAFFTDLIGRPPVERDGVFLWTQAASSSAKSESLASPSSFRRSTW